jgi:dTDP-glucose 4,6-dehydratase
MALASGAPRFHYVSSGAVYGRGRPGAEKIAETSRWGPDPLAPGTAAYDEGKRAAELLCGIYHQTRGLPVVVSRCFSFVGPRLPLDAHFAAGNFVRDALAGGPVRVSGDGTPVRSYLYLADLAWWLWTLLASGRPGQAYNTGSDEPVSIAELARLTGDCFLPPLEVIISEKPPPGAAPSGQVPSTGKARGELGLHPRVGLKEALTRTLSWARREAT